MKRSAARQHTPQPGFGYGATGSAPETPHRAQPSALLRRSLLVLGIAVALPAGAAQYQKARETMPNSPFCEAMFEYLKNLPPDRPLICRLFSDPEAPYDRIDWHKIPLEGNERWLWRVATAQKESGELPSASQNDPEAAFTKWLENTSYIEDLRERKRPKIFLAHLDVDGKKPADTLIGAPVVDAQDCRRNLRKGDMSYLLFPRAYVPGASVDEVLSKGAFKTPLYALDDAGWPVQYKKRFYALDPRWDEEKRGTRFNPSDLKVRADIMVNYYNFVEHLPARRNVTLCGYSLSLPGSSGEQLIERQIGSS